MYYKEISDMNAQQEGYLDKYLNSLPPNQNNKYSHVLVDYFCADETNANISAELVRTGEKTATCGLKALYEIEAEALPSEGTLTVVTDWSGNPTSIIETTEVTECRFDEVSEEFAAAEGEGDKSLEWWRKAHWAFFSKECEQHGIEPSEDMMLVLERFKVVHV